MPRSLASFGLLLLIAASGPAAAGVIVPVSITRTVSASSSVTDSASGMQDADSDQPPASTNPAFSFSISASAPSSLSGWSASASARSGTVVLNEQGSSGYIQLTNSASASVSTGTSSCSTCRGSAQSSASLSLTFDLLTPIHVYSFTSGATFASITMFRGNEQVAFGGPLGGFPFDMSPGRYTLVGNSSAWAVHSVLDDVRTSGALLGVAFYTVIPEPSSDLLMSLGLLVLAGSRRARSAQR